MSAQMNKGDSFESPQPDSMYIFILSYAVKDAIMTVHAGCNVFIPHPQLTVDIIIGVARLKLLIN